MNDYNGRNGNGYQPLPRSPRDDAPPRPRFCKTAEQFRDPPPTTECRPSRGNPPAPPEARLVGPSSDGVLARLIYTALVLAVAFGLGLIAAQ
jgi:hypothetical protein